MEYKLLPMILVDCDLIHGAGKKVYTLIQLCQYTDELDDVLVCNLPPEECVDIPFTSSSLRGYVNYTKIDPSHRVAHLPLVPWYKKKLDFIPENNSFNLR